MWVFKVPKPGPSASRSVLVGILVVGSGGVLMGVLKEGIDARVASAQSGVIFLTLSEARPRDVLIAKWSICD
jgi:hypothetical protein